MNARERAICAMNGGVPDMVPTMEIVFELEEALTDKKYVLGSALKRLSGREKARVLDQNVEIYIACARKLGHSSITVHPAPTPWFIPGELYYPEFTDQLYVIRRIYEQAGKDLLVAAGIDGTYAIPDGTDFQSFAFQLADDPEGMKEQAQKNVAWAVEQMKQMIDSGAEVLYLCSDYCFNQGPFLSPAMFGEFIFPYLQWQVQELKRAGAFVIKHTDGNIMPILDLMVEAGPHVIHSIDPLAGMDMQTVRNAVKGKAALMGNVDSTKLQLRDRPGVFESCKSALSGSKEGGTIFSTCNSVFGGIELDSYLFMLECLRKYNAGEML